MLLFAVYTLIRFNAVKIDKFWTIVCCDISLPGIDKNAPLRYLNVMILICNGFHLRGHVIFDGALMLSRLNNNQGSLQKFLSVFQPMLQQNNARQNKRSIALHDHLPCIIVKIDC